VSAVLVRRVVAQRVHHEGRQRHPHGDQRVSSGTAG
jgi:hypothetical protein